MSGESFVIIARLGPRREAGWPRCFWVPWSGREGDAPGASQRAQLVMRGRSGPCGVCPRPRQRDGV